ncbi:uncharacterized protein [Montipora foliosa]|uniref:uncharacterized protein n=1 Tax=Montipora foliosa TaxID=591990 RepID=UPI0035F13712
MSSAILLLLLMNVMRVEDLEKQGFQCHWVCDVNYKQVVGACEQIRASFKFSKRVHQNCTDDATVNSWNFITVGIIVAFDVDNHFSDFLIEHLSRRQFLFGDESTDLESVNSSVSCLLQPTSIETGSISSNGLHAIYSPLFYLRNSVRNSQKTPYLGYVEVGGRFHLSAGFTNSMSPEYRLEFDQSDLTRVRIWSFLFLLLFLQCIPSLLTLFCATIKTVQIERLSRAINVEEPGEDLPSEATRSPTEQEDSIKIVVLPATARRDAGKECRSSRPVATEHGEDFFPGIIHDLGLGSSTAASGHNAFGSEERNSTDEHSVMVGLRRPAAKVKKLPATVPEFSQTHSGGTSDHRVSGSSSAMGEFERNKPQTGVQHAKIQNRKLDSVPAMETGAPASPVGLRSFIANKAFPNSKSRLSLFYKLLKFFLLIIFPLFIPIIADVFVLAIPRLCNPRIASNLPSPFLIKSVFNFTFEVYPGFLYFCLVSYIFRMGFFCFPLSSSNWVPSFLFRKHFVCFFCNHYLMQFIYPSNSWSACDECKEASDLPKHCEIPVNVKCNNGCSLLEIFKKDWKDVFQDFYPKCKGRLSSGSEDESSCPVVWKLVSMILSGLLFIALVILDTVASLPIISLCYGRVWFTKNWSQNRYTQLGLFIAEFSVICFSVVWIVYFLFCCFLSMAVALSSFYIAARNYPVEIVFYLAVNIMVWHIIWTCYSFFTNIYDDLLLKLFDACINNHESELNQYKEGNVQYIPQRLFTSACDKIKPVGNSVKKLFFLLSVWVVGLFFLISFIMGSSTDIPISKVLAGTVTFLMVVHPSLWDFLLTRGKKQERKDAVLKKKVKDHVDAFFKGKLD